MTAEPSVVMETAPEGQQRQRSKANSWPTRYAPSVRAILDALEKSPDYTFTTGELIVAAGVKDYKLGTGILSRLVKSGKVERPRRGMYRHRRAGTIARSDPPESVHGVHLALVSGAPSPHLAAMLTTLPNAKPTLDKDGNPTPDGKVELHVPLGRDREAIILVSSSLEVRIACTDNPMPLEVLYGVLWALDGMFQLGFTTLPWEASRIEVNRDHVGYTIDGASAVTINLKDFMMKAYQRPGILREEIVMHHVPLVEVLDHMHVGEAVGNARIAEATETLGKEFALMRRSYDAVLVELAELKKQRKANGKTTPKQHKDSGPVFVTADQVK